MNNKRNQQSNSVEQNSGKNAQQSGKVNKEGQGVKNTANRGTTGSCSDCAD